LGKIRGPTFSFFGQIVNYRKVVTIQKVFQHCLVLVPSFRGIERELNRGAVSTVSPWATEGISLFV
jgi:hypothetical protein